MGISLKEIHPKCLKHQNISIKGAFTAPFHSLLEAQNNYESYCLEENINVDDQLLIKLTEDAVTNNTCTSNRDKSFDLWKFCNICEFNKKSYHSSIKDEIKLLNYILKPDRRVQVIDSLSNELFNYYYLEELENSYAQFYITRVIYDLIMDCDTEEVAQSVVVSYLKELNINHPEVKELLSPILKKVKQKVNINKTIEKIKNSKLTLFSSEDSSPIMNLALNDSTQIVDNQVNLDIEVNSLPSNESNNDVEPHEQEQQHNNQVITDSKPSEQVTQTIVPKITEEGNTEQDTQSKQPTKGYSIDLLTELTSKRGKRDNIKIELEKTTDIIENYFKSSQSAAEIKDNNEPSTIAITSPPSSYHMSIRELEDIKNEDDAELLIIGLKHKEVFIKTVEKVELLVMNDNSIPVKYILNLNNDVVLYFIDMLFHNFSITKFVDDLSFFKGHIELDETRSIYDIKTFKLFFGVKTGLIYDMLNKRQIEAMSKENRRILKLETQLTIVKIFHMVKNSNYALSDIPEKITTDEILINAIDNRLFSKYNIKFVSGGTTEIKFYIPGKDKQVTDQIIMEIEKLKRIRNIQKGIKVRWRIVDTD